MPQAEFADLHVHSTASDGTLAPAAIVALAVSQGVKVMGLTDHDTTRGHGEALAAGAAAGVTVVPGVEISVDPGERGEIPFHLLGYFAPRPGAAAPVEEILARIRGARVERNTVILGKLARLGLAITEDEVRRESGGGTIGRPHIAQVLLKRGFVDSLDEAFRHYLGRGRAAYADRERLDAAGAIGRIGAAGGAAVLAHPVVLEEVLGRDGLARLVERLRGLGLAGLEVMYADHTGPQTKRYAELAERLGLLPTGGTDFHGDNRPGVSLGHGRGQLAVPRAWADALLARLG